VQTQRVIPLQQHPGIQNNNQNTKNQQTTAKTQAGGGLLLITARKLLKTSFLSKKQASETNLSPAVCPDQCNNTTRWSFFCIQWSPTGKFWRNLGFM